MSENMGDALKDEVKVLAQRALDYVAHCESDEGVDSEASDELREQIRRVLRMVYA